MIQFYSFLDLPVPYKCTVCGKTFKSKSNCCYHKHCAASSEKPFSCSTCNRKFSTKTHYNYHNLIHTGRLIFTYTSALAILITYEIPINVKNL